MPSVTHPPPPATDIRDAFFGELYRLAKEDRRVMVLTDDQSAFALDRIRSDLPAQYFNMGIAEQNLISVAAGMALGGLKPYVCGISNFVSLRCCEQISVDLCAMKLPVTIVGSGGGLTYASDGPTHHGTQDVAVMSTMPHLTLLNPSDATATSACAGICYTLPGPAYVRIEKGILPTLYDAQADFSIGFGKLRQGKDLLLVSTGYMTQVAVETATTLDRMGISTGILDLFRIKPCNEAGLLSEFRKYQHLAVLEEQSPIGGIACLVSSLLTESRLTTPLRRFSLPDAPCYCYGSREWLHMRNGLDASTIAREISAWISTVQGAAVATTFTPKPA